MIRHKKEILRSNRARVDWGLMQKALERDSSSEDKNPNDL